METICNIKKYYEPNSAKKIISCSIFTMKSSYRGFDKYIDGLDSMISYFKQKLPDFKIRLYFDSKLHDTFIIDKYMNEEYLQLAEYKCNKFIKNDYHIGTFGTLVRFIPLYKASDEQLDIVIVSDVDIKKSLNFYYNYFKLFINSDNDMTFINMVNYKYYYPPLFVNKNIDNVALATVGIRNPSYDISQLTSFMDEVIEEKKYKNVTDKLYNIKKGHIRFKNNIDIARPFIYGIDEYFINRIFLDNYFINNKKIACLILRDKASSYVFSVILGFAGIKPNDALLYLNNVKSDNQYIKNRALFKKERQKVLDIIEKDEKLYLNHRYDGYYIGLKLQKDYYYYFSDNIKKYNMDVFKLYPSNFLILDAQKIEL